MEPIKEEGVAITPNEETNETAETSAETLNKPFGLANDETQYSEESEAVIKYKELFPDVETDAAISSVISIHNRIIAGEEPAGEAEEVVEIIKAKLLENSEELEEGEGEDLEDDGEGKDNGESEGNESGDSEEGSEGESESSEDEE